MRPACAGATDRPPPLRHRHDHPRRTGAPDHRGSRQEALPAGQGVYVKDYPKDDEQRSVQIDEATCQLLQAHIDANDLKDDGLLFTSSAGTALSRNNFRTKFWVPAVTAAKVQHTVTFHNLRAAHASWLLAGGADIIVVQEHLGHKRITTTQQYTGTLPDAGDRALAAFRKIRYAEAPPRSEAGRLPQLHSPYVTPTLPDRQALDQGARGASADPTGEPSLHATGRPA